MQLKELSIDEFTKFYNTFPIKSIYQTTEYGLVMSKEEYKPIYLGLIKENSIVAGSLILIAKEEGFKYAYAPRGYLIDYNNTELVKTFTNEIKQYLNKLKVMAIKINPIIIKNIYDFRTQKLTHNPNYDNIYNNLIKNDYYHLGYNNYFEALKPRFEAIINLSLPINNLFYNVKKEYRTKIRSAVKNGIEIFKGNIDNINDLFNFTKNKYSRNISYFINSYNIYNNKNMIDLYYTKLNTKTYLKEIQNKVNFYEKEINDLNNKIMQTKRNGKLINKKINYSNYLNKYKTDLIYATKLLRKYPEGIITSAIMTIKENNIVTLLIDGYDPEYKRFNSKHLLIWQLIRIYQNSGYTTFNLGGISNVTVDNDKYVGLNNFKLNFGAFMYEYAGDFELITNKRNYNLYRNYVPLKNLIKKKLK